MGWSEYRENYIREQEKADVWKDFHGGFMELASEEERIERVARKDRLLRAYCTYKEHAEGWERGKPNQGLISLLKTPETGVWAYSDGVNENFQARVRALASRAGVALGSPKGTDPEDFWLHQLFLDLFENNSDQLFAASKEGGMILRVCVASATFCSRLERKAVLESEPSTTITSGTAGTLPAQSELSPQGVEGKSADRRALVRAYIEEVRTQKGKRITRKDIWAKAGYQTRTEFERWVRQDPKHPNKAADEIFTRLLCVEKPHLK